MRAGIRAACVASLGWPCWAVQQAAAQGIVGTGFFPGAAHTELLGLSGDGRIGVGAALQTDGLGHAYWWSPGGPLQEIVPGAAFAADADGSVVVGTDFVGLAFRWSPIGGVQSLGTLPGKTWSSAAAVSADGAVIVGVSAGVPAPETNAIGRAFRWAAGGMLDLGVLPDRNASSATGVSADGSVVAGSSFYTPPRGASSQSHPFLWTAAGGMQDLGTLWGEASAAAISGDASVVVGSSEVPTGATHAFRWTATGGMQDLGLPPGLSSNNAQAVSAEGRTVVGFGWDGAQNHATLWTAQLGAVDLNAYLPMVGIDLGPWILNEASAVSADGRTIAGMGKRGPNWEGWLVTLPCYANCDGSTLPPVLNVSDFVCFLNAFAAGDGRANCDGSTTPPVLNVLDFGCFLDRFAAGCS